jgi:hypothetical protein
MQVEIMSSASDPADPHSQDAVRCARCGAASTTLRRVLVPSDRDDRRESVILVFLCDNGHSFRIEFIAFGPATYCAKYPSGDRPLRTRTEREPQPVAATA